MSRIVLAALVLLNCVVFGTETFGQAGQTIKPCTAHTADREHDNHHVSDQL
jgi:hypothetical protein